MKSEILKELEKTDKQIILQWVILKMAHQIEESGLIQIDKHGNESLPQVEINFDYTSKVSGKRYKAEMKLDFIELGKNNLIKKHEQEEE